VRTLQSVDRWIDTHIHVSDRGDDNAVREHLLEDLLAVLDGAGTDLRLVISPDAYWNTVVRDEPDGAHRANAFIHSLVERAPDRLYGSCIVNPNFPDAALRTMEVCFEKWGFVQLGEMLQYMFNFRMNSDNTERVVRQAVEYDVPVQVHISTSCAATQGAFPRGGVEEMEDFLACVDRVPEATYILAHLVGTPRDNPPVVDGYLEMIGKWSPKWPDNFWAEIAQFNSPGVRSALARIPADRLLSGTDWTTRVGPPFLPFGTHFGLKSAAENPFPPSVGALAGFLRDAGASPATIERIAYRNAMELLRLAP